jgi:hypothetical protein
MATDRAFFNNGQGDYRRSDIVEKSIYLIREKEPGCMAIMNAVAG